MESDKVKFKVLLEAKLLNSSPQSTETRPFSSAGRITEADSALISSAVKCFSDVPLERPMLRPQTLASSPSSSAKQSSSGSGTPTPFSANQDVVSPKKVASILCHTSKIRWQFNLRTFNSPFLV